MLISNQLHMHSSTPIDDELIAKHADGIVKRSFTENNDEVTETTRSTILLPADNPRVEKEAIASVLPNGKVVVDRRRLVEIEQYRKKYGLEGNALFIVGGRSQLIDYPA